MYIYIYIHISYIHINTHLNCRIQCGWLFFINSGRTCAARGPSKTRSCSRRKIPSRRGTTWGHKTRWFQMVSGEFHHHFFGMKTQRSLPWCCEYGLPCCFLSIVSDLKPLRQRFIRRYILYVYVYIYMYICLLYIYRRIALGCGVTISFPKDWDLGMSHQFLAVSFFNDVNCQGTSSCV